MKLEKLPLNYPQTKRHKRFYMSTENDSTFPEEGLIWTCVNEIISSIRYSDNFNWYFTNAWIFRNVKDIPNKLLSSPSWSSIVWKIVGVFGCNYSRCQQYQMSPIRINIEYYTFDSLVRGRYVDLFTWYRWCFPEENAWGKYDFF